MSTRNVLSVIFYHVGWALACSLFGFMVLMMPYTIGDLVADPKLFRFALMRFELFGGIYLTFATVGRRVTDWLALSMYSMGWGRLVPGPSGQAIKLTYLSWFPCVGTVLIVGFFYAFFLFLCVQGEANWGIPVVPLSVFSIACLQTVFSPNALILDGDLAHYHFRWGSIKVRICDHSYIALYPQGRSVYCEIRHPLLVVRMSLNKVTQNTSSSPVSVSTALSQFIVPLK